MTTDSEYLGREEFLRLLSEILTDEHAEHHHQSSTQYKNPESKQKCNVEKSNAGCTTSKGVSFKDECEKVAKKNTRLKDGEEPGEYVKVYVIDSMLEKKRLFRIDISVARRLFQLEFPESAIELKCDIAAFQCVVKVLSTGMPAFDGSILPQVFEICNLLRNGPLFEMCLRFWRDNLDSVIVQSSDWLERNEEVLGCLAESLENLSLEDVPTAKLQENLYEKFTSFLTNETPNPSLGHFATAKTLQKCKHCKSIFEPSKRQFRCCNISISKQDGRISYLHEDDRSWHIIDEISAMQRMKNSWRLTYWELWGMCHYLRCERCKEDFPVSRTNGCRSHPGPKTNPEENDGVGVHSCCGERVATFKVIDKPTGCKKIPHVALVPEPDDKKILEIFEAMKFAILTESPENEQIEQSLQPREAITENRSLINSHVLAQLMKNVQPSNTKKKVPKMPKWIQKSSTVRNQDKQREFEEKVFVELKKFLSGDEVKPHERARGSYLDAEDIWWQSLKK